MARSESIKFKGTRQGVHVVLDPDAEFHDALVELDQRLKGSDQFFRQASVMLNLGDRPLAVEQLESLNAILAKYGLSVVSAEAADTDTRSMLRGAGVQVEMPGSARAERATEPAITTTVSKTAPEPEGLVVQRTLRSGQSLRHQGDVCLIGDVNPGAEISAGHNVIVWGSLRGTVHAGVTGDEDAVVCALELSPTQLRIATLVTRQPESSRADAECVPELARIVDGQIMVEHWEPRSKRVRNQRA